MGKTHQAAQSLLESGKGILVTDEYVDTMIERLMPDDARGDRPSTGQYVDLVLGAAGLNTWLQHLADARDLRQLILLCHLLRPNERNGH